MDLADADLADALREACIVTAHDHPEIAVLYLFGSVARGDASAASDLDIGVVYRRRGANPAHGDVANDLRFALRHVADLVDVIELEPQGPIFCHRVLSEGVLLFEGDRSRRLDFESETIVRAIDFRPTYELATRGKAKALRQWLRDSGLHQPVRR